MSLQLQLLSGSRLGASATFTTPFTSGPPAATAVATAATSPASHAAQLPLPTPPAQLPLVEAAAEVPPSSQSTVVATNLARQASEAPTKPKFERFGPYKPVRKSSTGGLTTQQQQSLERFMARFIAKTKRSREHAQKHRPHFADPRGVAGYRRVWKSIVYQISVQRSAGSKLWDIDDNQYIDIAMGFGLNLFGQSPEFVTNALHRQLDCGVEVGPQSPLAGEVAQLLCDFARKDRVTFCNTGSEAVMAAMRTEAALFQSPAGCLARTCGVRSILLTNAPGRRFRGGFPPGDPGDVGAGSRGVDLREAARDAVFREPRWRRLSRRGRKAAAASGGGPPSKCQ